MKRAIPILMLLAMLAGCASAGRLHKRNTAAIAAKRSGDTYTFKTWPTAADLCRYGCLELRRHHVISAPTSRFTISHFLSLVRWPFTTADILEEREPMAHWTVQIGIRCHLSRLEPCSEELGFSSRRIRDRAREREDRPSYTWHLIVIADTEKAVHAIVNQLPTFHVIPGAKQGP